MKKIKYLILLIPFLFITNVKAECTSMIDFTNTTLYTGYYDMGKSYFSNVSVNSITINSMNYTNVSLNLGRFYNFEPNKTYVLSFDIESESPNLFMVNDFVFEFNTYTKNQIQTAPYQGFNSLNGTSFKYNIEMLSTMDDPTMLRLYINRTDWNSPITIKNAYLYEESEYNACTSPTVTYTYTFYVDNEVYETDTVEENTVIELPENPTKEGYTFTGWTLNGEAYTGGAITGDIDIIANFIENQQEPEPASSVNVDLSVIIPYLITIGSLIMLLIEINFIRNLFKSRR